MSGSTAAFNIAKDKIGYYWGLPDAGSSLVLVLLVSTGLEADDTLNNYDDLASLLAAANDEATCTNYSRKTLASLTRTVDDTNNRVELDVADVTYTALGGASNNTIAKAIVCYKPAAGSADSAIIPLTYHSIDFTTDGSDQTITIPYVARVA